MCHNNERQALLGAEAPHSAMYGQRGRQISNVKPGRLQATTGYAYSHCFTALTSVQLCIAVHCCALLCCAVSSDARGARNLQVFTTRNLAPMAANAEAVKEQVEEFKSVVPLVQVSPLKQHSVLAFSGLNSPDLQLNMTQDPNQHAWIDVPTAKCWCGAWQCTHYPLPVRVPPCGLVAEPAQPWYARTALGSAYNGPWPGHAL